MKNLKMLLASAAVMAISATAASAVVIDFGMQGTDEPGESSLDVSGGGYTITATGIGVSGDSTVDGLVTRTGSPVNGPNQGGLGVRSSRGDSNQAIDGGINANQPYKDILLLTFTKAVKIVSVSFSQVGEVDAFGPDHANITVDGNAIGNFAIANFGFPSFLPAGWVGKVFGFGALDQNDNYKLRAIEVTPVPVPPAALLLATGVAGIGALARRRNKKA